MRKRLLKLFVLGFSICAFCSGVSAADKQSDWKAMDSLLARYYSQFNSQGSLTLETIPTFIEDWNAWKNDHKTALEAFKKNYGSTREQIMKAFEGMNPPKGSNVQIWPLFSSLNEADTTAHEKLMADWARQSAEENYSRWTNFKAPKEKAELKLKYAQRAEAFINLAASLDPENSYKELKAKIRKAIKDSQSAFEKNLKTIKWPGHNQYFKGNPKALSRAAVSFLEKHPDWTKPEYNDEHVPVAACVTGSDWKVWKKTILGQPTQYSIDLLVAFKGKKNPKTLYAYHMVFYTKEEAGVKPELPFHFANSRQYACFQILKSAVPQSGGSDSGVFGIILRALLCALLFCTSLFALESVLKQQYKFMETVYRTLDPLLGVAAPLSILAALVFLLLNLLTLSPFADILPQMSLFLTGLMLRAEKAAGKEPADMKSFSGALRINKEAIGWAGMFFSILHILIGRALFF